MECSKLSVFNPFSTLLSMYPHRLHVCRDSDAGCTVSCMGGFLCMYCNHDQRHLSRCDLGIRLIHTTAYHPIANGIIERFRRQLKTALKTYPDPNSWATLLPMVLLGIRTALKDDLGCTAAELVMEPACGFLVSSLQQTRQTPRAMLHSSSQQCGSCKLHPLVLLSNSHMLTQHWQLARMFSSDMIRHRNIRLQLFQIAIRYHGHTHRTHPQILTTPIKFSGASCTVSI